MQTIGKTTNKMDFPPTWTDILLKSISSKANYTIDVKIGAKRIAADSQDLRDIPKKRRKQSNPTRISSNEKTANSELGTKSSASDADNSKVCDVGTDEESSSTFRHQCSIPLPLNLTKPEIQNVPATDEARPVQFLNNVPQKSSDASTGAPKSLSAPYQPCAKSFSYVEKKDGYPTVSSDGMLSFKNQPAGTSTANFGQSPVQIFNPEAFCELCNKEFCNKYFLKTHKANKHGVFIDGSLNGSITDQSDKNRLLHALPATCDFSSNTGDTAAAALSLFKSPAPYSQPLVNTNAYVSKGMMNNQTRAFCGICNKEFCNKYFVKRHKAKIHGIIDDGDYRAANDDAPLKLKTNLQIKSEIFDFAVSDAYKDSEHSAVSPPTAVNGAPLELAKMPVAKPFADTDESATRSVIVETPCSYNIKVEHAADDEDNEMDCASKSSNELQCDANGYYGNELSSGSSARGVANASYELALFHNEFPKPDGEDILRRLAEFAANDTGAPIDMANGADYEFGRVVSADQNADEKTVDFNGSTRVAKGTAEPDTVIVRNVETGDARTTSYEDKPAGLLKCYVCNALVDGPLEAHVFDKHEGFVRELQLMSDSPEANGPHAEHSCHECQRTFVSGASWRAHAEQGECAAAKGAGGRASAGSKSSAENDESFARVDRKHSAATLSSFCKICNKELCNKYFMKTHMQRMHGISIRNGNHIGGVVCDVCNKELCSKYFLRVHKQNSHGIVENGAACGPRYWPDGTSAAAAAENGPSLSDEPPDNGHLHRYYKHYAEACTVCYRRFRSPKWLSAHLLNDHGDEGRAQWKHLQLQEAIVAAPDETAGPSANCGETGRELQQQMKQYRCSYCPFATSVLSFLFVHEKFHLTENGKTAAAATEDAFAPQTCSACCATFPDRTRWEKHFASCRAGKEFGGSSASRSPDTGRNSTNASEDSSADANGNDAVVAYAAEPGPPQPTAAVTVPSEPPSNHEPFIMQSFFLENCSVSPSVKQSESCSGRSDSFHSSLVYLPVKEKLTSTVNVFFKLTPT